MAGTGNKDSSVLKEGPVGKPVQDQQQRLNLQKIVQLTQLVAQADQILASKSIPLPYCKIELSGQQLDAVRKGRDDLKKRLAELVGGL